MKKVLFVLSFLMVYGMTYSQTELSQLFEKYESQEDVVHLKMNGSMFNSEKSDKIKSNIDYIELLVLPAEIEGGKKDLKNVGAIARKANYESVMEVRSAGDFVDIYSIGTDDIFDSLLISVISDDNLVLVKLDGKILRSDIDDLDFDGGQMNFLEQLKK